ncbi:hypothetical protein LUZ62_034033 [Rhynchospora pubera]|uniref:ABC transmembrane type-1 domain-containing protein n=1 Tax=Rhynchospora pubera TaxID=906938 RepID=A0AAV8HUU6_9POAL|nr:hypothetical protein LUZ62_034033 [Rhynchospora pubera]
MKEHQLDLVLVPMALSVVIGYHLWLLHTIIHHPTRTVVGLNAIARKRWATAIMANPEKNAMLAVQTLRNYIMASTVLATTAITLASLISVFMGTSSPLTAASMLIYGNKTHLLSSIKYFAISLCFISAFVCNVQAIRYYAHTSMLLGISSLQNSLIHEEKKEEKEKKAHRTNEFVEYVTNGLNKGSRFWSFTFLDTTTEHSRVLHGPRDLDKALGEIV